MGKRGQVSIEYLAVFAFAMLLTIPLIILYIDQSNSMKIDTANAQAYRVVSKIADSADEIYYQGSPAKKTIRIAFPEGIQEVNITGSYIEFKINIDGRDYYVGRNSHSPLNGTLRKFSGDHVITFTARDEDVLLEDN
jgi:uncharacterized protein (UPF0333 family)